METPVDQVYLDDRIRDIGVNVKCASLKPVMVDSLLETDVLQYIQYIVKSNPNYFQCLKTICFWYRYVALQLKKRGLKKDMCIADGPITSPELERSKFDLTRITQESYYGRENIALIAQSKLSFAIKQCKSDDHRSRLLELKSLLPFYDLIVKFVTCRW